MKNKLFTSVLATCLLLASNISFAGSNWELAYEADANGTIVNGTLNNLVTAIKNGADIKLNVTWTNNWNQRVDTIYPERVGFMDNGNVVYLAAHLHSVGGGGAIKPYLVEDARPIVLFRTDGVAEVLYYNGSGDTVTSHTTNNLKMKWFANK